VFAPSGRDADLAKALLREGGHDADIVTNLTDLVRELSRGAGMAVIADEAILTSGLRPLTEIIGSQEPWSDFPILILTKHGAGIEHNPTAARLAELLGNVTFLERPFHPTSMISIAKSAIRARRRQYEARARLVALSESQERLSLLTTTLEQRVDEEVNERRRAEEALLQAHKMEALGQLTGGIAHDFNNLLTIIQGNLQVLEELPGVSADAQPLVLAAARAARRGAELTGKLLAFSRRQMLQPSSVDLQALLHSLSDMLRRTLDQRITIEVSVAADCPAVRADPGQLESALLNIAINARDAMPEGGTLRFVAGPLAAPVPGLERELDPAGRYASVTVGDSGCGMPETVRERAFEPFFTTKQVGRGTGLGLSTVYGFAKQSSGAVALDSAPGRGTTVHLVLPVATIARADHAADGDAADAGPIRPGLKVLLVEDDAGVRAVAQHFLVGMGCELSVCASAEDALPLLTPEADFELLVTDIALGAGMRGTKLAWLAQQRLQGLKVLLVSGYSEELLRADREAPAAWELLPKPYSRNDLGQAIARVLAR
ncbi:MAG: response regulator, partial [Paucibacter sp.]|nr:response regulator [Roseateles sp.]